MSILDKLQDSVELPAVLLPPRPPFTLSPLPWESTITITAMLRPVPLWPETLQSPPSPNAVLKASNTVWKFGSDMVQVGSIHLGCQESQPIRPAHDGWLSLQHLVALWIDIGCLLLCWSLEDDDVIAMLLFDCVSLACAWCMVYVSFLSVCFVLFCTSRIIKMWHNKSPDAIELELFCGNY